MRRDVVIVGSSGMLGRELVEACARRGRAAVGLGGREAVDVTSEASVRRMMVETAPGVVINATGYTDVDGAEANPAAADLLNRAGPGNLGRACRDAGALLVHYSTDYVFDGRATRPYRVNDEARPINAYGRSKLAGEREIAASGCRFLLIRTSWLFAPHGRNFVTTIADLASRRPCIDVVNDQRGRPTYAADLADMTLSLLDKEAGGTLHAANDGECSWHELAKAVVEHAGLSCDVRPCATSAHPRPAARPAYSVLDLSTTIDQIGPPRHWREALAECIRHKPWESRSIASS